MTMECAGWKNSSCDDGPGIRSVLFFQGCSMNCPGCQNASTHKHGYGKTLSVEEVVSHIEKNCRNKKITISGGEPLEQPKALRMLVETLREKDYNICIYTGWSFDSIPSYIKEKADYLKCGGFDLKKRNGSLMYVGSENQMMYRNAGNGVFKPMPLRYEEYV